MASIRYIATDIDRSVAFYRDNLGFKVDMHNPGKFAALNRDDLTLYLSAPGAGSGGTAGGRPQPGAKAPPRIAAAAGGQRRHGVLKAPNAATQ